jgi:drug/metabolite transporter (DMT)-like permease
LQLLAATFGVACLSGVTWLLISGGWSALLRLKQPLAYLGFSFAALFGYHALYFTALSLSPPAQASLVAYLWPLLIVCFAALANRSQFRVRHLVGASMGLAGTAVLVLSRAETGTAWHQNPLGLVAAFSCAVIWSTYSVLNSRFRNVPSEAMVTVCGLVAIVGWIAHLLIDSQTMRPSGAQWLAILALGLGPVGLAFLAWDHGTKHGNIALLATMSYAAPVLSTLFLVLFGFAHPGIQLLVACVLVVGGAWVASTTTRRTPITLQRIR